MGFLGEATQRAYEAARDARRHLGSLLTPAGTARPRLSVTAWNSAALRGAVVRLHRLDDLFLRSYDFRAELPDFGEDGGAAGGGAVGGGSGGGSAGGGAVGVSASGSAGGSASGSAGGSASGSAGQVDGVDGRPAASGLAASDPAASAPAPAAASAPAPAAASAPTFVLIHGIGVSARYFVPLATRLQRFGRVVMFDMPGFSDLPNPPHPLSIAGFARCVHEAMAELEVTNPIVLGHSMGAQVATELLARDPQLAQNLILIGPPINAGERTFVDAGLRFMQSSVYESARLGLVAARAYAACGMQWFMQTVPTMMRYPIEERIELSRAKLTLARGEHDYVAPTNWLKTIADHAHRTGTEPVAIHSVAAAAHSVIYIHPAQVSELILEAAEIPVPTWLRDSSRDEAARAVIGTRPGGMLVRQALAGFFATAVRAAHGGRWLATAAIESPTWVRLVRDRFGGDEPGGHGDGRTDGPGKPTEGPTAAPGDDPRRRLEPAKPPAAASSRIAVIFIPGITETWRAMRPLREAVREAGYATWHMDDSGNMMRPIGESARLLAAQIDRLCARGYERVVLVAHSKGGLVAKTAALADERVALVVAVATPWSGSSLAGLLPRWVHRWDDLRPGAQDLQALARQRGVHDRVVSLMPSHDQEVPNGSYLPGATNRRLPVRGHQRVLDARCTAAAVLEFLGRV